MPAGDHGVVAWGAGVNADELLALLIPAFGIMVIFFTVRGPRRAGSPDFGASTSVKVLEPWALRWKCKSCGDGSLTAEQCPRSATPSETARGAIRLCPVCGGANYISFVAGRKIRKEGKDQWEWRDDTRFSPPKPDDKKRDNDEDRKVPDDPARDAAASLPNEPAPQGKQEVH